VLFVESGSKLPHSIEEAAGESGSWGGGMSSFQDG
jgi:hypothetical protein